MSHFSFRHQGLLIAIAATISMVPLSHSQAGCIEDGIEAAQACKSDDIGAGMNGYQAWAATQLVAKAKAGNELVDPTKFKQAAQCKNRAYQSKVLSALSSLKSQACSQALTKCVQSCGSNPMFAQYAVACQSLTADAKKAHQQSEQLMADMVQNMDCWNGSTAELMNPAGGNGPGETCALNDNACMCRQNPSSAACKNQDGANNRALAEGDDDVAGKKGGSGKFNPKGFSDPDLSASFSNPAYKGGPNTEYDIKIGDDNSSTGQGGNVAAGGANGASGGNAFGSKGVRPGAVAALAARNPASAKDKAKGKKGGRDGWSLGAGGIHGDAGFDDEEEGGEATFSERQLGGLKLRNGITGAMGPSLFEKVSKQYQVQRRTMFNE
jgi:hypothetical protein